MIACYTASMVDDLIQTIIPRFANLLSKQGVQIVWYIAILVRDLSLSQMYDKIGISQATSVLRLKV